MRLPYFFLLFFILFSACRFFPGENAALYKAIPESTALVFEALNIMTLQKDFSENRIPMGHLLRSLPATDSLLVDLARLEAVFANQAELKLWIQKSPMIAAFSLQAADSLHPILIIDLKKAFDLSPLIQTLPGSVSRNSTQANGQEIHTLFSNTFGKFSIARQGNFLIAAYNAWQVAEVSSRMQEKTAGEWTALAPKDRMMPGEHAKVTLLCQTALARLSDQAQPEWRAWIPALAGGQAWYSLHWGAKAYFLRSEATENSAFGAHDETFLYEALSVAPAFAELIQSYQWTGRAPIGEPLEQADFSRYVKPWMAGPCLFLAGASPTAEQYWLIQTKDPAAMLENIQACGQAGGLLAREEYQTFSCLQMANGAFLEPIAGRNKSFQTPACTVIGKFLVAASSRAALERLIDQYVVGETMLNNPDFLNSGGGQTNGNRLNAVSWRFLSSCLADIGVRLGNQAMPGNAWLIMGWQAKKRGVSKSLPRFHAQEQAQEQADLIWKYPLRHAAVGIPSIAAADDENGRRILMQDAGHNLYCLTQDGRLVWERNVGGRLFAPVQTLDWNGNGVYCFLFNTPDAVYVLDQTGNDVPGFPLALKNKASGPVSGVRYGDSGRYQFFVACEPGNVYAYDHFGRPLEAWNPLSEQGQITQPISHFRCQGKDYHVLLSDAGRLSLMGRDARPIVPPATLNAWSGGIYVVKDPESSPKIFCLGRNGRLYAGDAGGHFDDIQAMEGPVKAAFHEKGRRGGIYYLSGNRFAELSFEAGKAGQTIRATLPAAMDTVFVPAQAYTGFLNRSRRQILLSGENKPAENPWRLAGTTPFVLDESVKVPNADLIIVGFEQQIFVYQIPKGVQN